MRPGSGGHALLAAMGATRVCEAVYPAGHSALVEMPTGVILVPNNDGPKIIGDLYQVNTDSLILLDWVNNVKGSNRRVRIRVWDVDTGEPHRPWVYVLANPDKLHGLVTSEESNWALTHANRLAAYRKKVKEAKEAPPEPPAPQAEPPALPGGSCGWKPRDMGQRVIVFKAHGKKTPEDYSDELKESIAKQHAHVVPRNLAPDTKFAYYTAAGSRIVYENLDGVITCTEFTAPDYKRSDEASTKVDQPLAPITYGPDNKPVEGLPESDVDANWEKSPKTNTCRCCQEEIAFFGKEIGWVTTDGFSDECLYGDVHHPMVN